MRLLVSLFTPGLLAAVLSFALAPLAIRLAFRLGAIDQPGARKIHKVPVARLGGLAVVGSVVLTLLASWLLPLPSSLALPRGTVLGLSLGLLPILCVSLLDDVRPVPALHKLAAHALGAAVAVAFGVSLSPAVHVFGLELSLGWFSVPLSVFWFIGVTNGFNLVDGLDGLSAGLALISAGSLTVVFLVSHQYVLAGVALVLAGALAGFLPFNLFPARVFLGDTGATALGFWLAGLALSGGARLSQGFATLLPLFAIGLPIAETLVSVMRRVVRRFATSGGQDGVFTADRNHMHHRLLALGVDHRRAVLILYGAATVFALGGMASILVSTRKAGLLLIALLVAASVGIARLGYDEFAVIRKGSVLNVYEFPVLRRSFFVVFVDLAMVVVAVYLAAGLKWDDWGIDWSRPFAFQLTALLAPATVGSFWLFGLYKGAWKHASLDDFLRTAAAIVVASAAALVTALFAIRPDVGGFFVIYTLLMLCFVNGSRMSYRVLQHRMWRSREGQRVLIYGAGSGGAAALRELLSNRDAGMQPVGFVDDDPNKDGQVVNGYPVLGTFEDLQRIVTERGVKTVVVSSSKIPEERVRRAFELCHLSGARLVRFQMVFEPVIRVVEGEEFRMSERRRSSASRLRTLS